VKSLRPDEKIGLQSIYQQKLNYLKLRSLSAVPEMKITHPSITPTITTKVLEETLSPKGPVTQFQ